jgi:hypothetical protein
MTPLKEKTDPGAVLKDVFRAEHGSDPDSARQALGKELVNRLFMLYRSARLHTLENDAVTAAIGAFLKVLGNLEEGSPTPTLTAMEDSFYLDSVLLKVDFTSFENFRFLLQLFEKAGVGGVQFLGLPGAGELRGFIRELLRASADTKPGEWIGNASFPSLRVTLPGESQETSRSAVSVAENRADPHYLLKLYVKTTFFVEDFLSHLAKGDFPSMNRLQRIVHEFIDAMGSDVDTLLILAGARPGNRTIEDQSVRVMILSLLLGRELGMTKRQLSDLGPAALLHDIGKAQLPADLLGKTGELTEEDWRRIREAPMNSLLQLIRLKGFNESALKRLLVAYEHPLVPQDGMQKLSILARVVAVTHCYVAMTSRQTYRDPLFPHETLRLMKKEAGTKFDPLLLDVLAKIISPHPAGSLILLDSREVAIVVKNTPILKILYDAQGNRTERQPRVWDRAHPKAMRFLDPEALGINPVAVLFGPSG